MVSETPSGYSSTVRLQLAIGSQRFALAQIGGGQLIFRDEVVLPGNSGEVIMHIDERERRWLVTWEASDEPRQTIVAEFRDAAKSISMSGPTVA